MPKTIRAKFQCWAVSDTGYSERVALHPVYSADPDSENHAFWKATPNGNLEMYIDNPDAKGTFEVGKSYYLDISEAPAQPTT